MMSVKIEYGQFDSSLFTLHLDSSLFTLHSSFFTPLSQRNNLVNHLCSLLIEVGFKLIEISLRRHARLCVRHSTNEIVVEYQDCSKDVVYCVLIYIT